MKYKAYRAVDVSRYQGVIDYGKMYRAGVRAVIVRAGQGDTADPMLYTNLNSAHANKLLVGCYYVPYTQTHSGVTMASLRGDAARCVNVFHGWMKYVKLDLPVFIDWEYANDDYFKRNSGLNLTTAGRTEFIRSCAENLRKKGYSVGIYTNPDYLSSKLTKGAFGDYPLFLAQYVRHGAAVSAADVPQTYGMPMLWQYDTGRIDGCTADIDLDWYYVPVG